jgi:DNA-binding SARP family transcriptional activator/TolB-like protein
MMAHHTLRLLGGISLHAGDGTALTGRAVQKRRLALLALLAMSKARRISRDRILACLWPDSQPEQARHLLSVSLYDLRKGLGENAIISHGDEIELSACAVTTDVEAFEAAAREGRYADADALFAGPFLDGFYISGAPDFEHWVDGERDRLCRSRAALLEQLARHFASTGDAAAAADAWLRLAALDPCDSRVMQEAMLALEAAGNRAAAIRQARVHATLMREEFGAEPDGQVEALARRLLDSPQPVATPAPPPEATPAAQPSHPPPPAPVVTVPEPAASPSAAAPAWLPETGSAPDAAAPSSGWRRVAIGAGYLGLLTLLLVASWQLLGLAGGRVAAADSSVHPVRVAVLPFQDLTPSASASDEYALFGDGLGDELRHKLLGVQGLQLSSAVSAFTFRGDVDIDTVARMLNVRYVVAGTFRVSGDRIAVIAKLHDAVTKTVLWMDAYNEPRDSRSDHIAMQSDIAQQIVRALPGHLPLSPPHEQSAGLTADMSAAQLYTAGRSFLLLRRTQDMGMALRYFLEAASRDPDFALAHAAVAEAYALLGGYDYGGLEPKHAFEQARAAAQRALRLDPTLAQAHAALGAVYFHYEWKWEEAERAFVRAIELDAGYAQAHHWYSLLLHARGRQAEAFRAVERGSELDLLSLIMKAAVARQHYFAAHFDSAAAHYEQVLRLDPTFVTARFGLGMTYAQLGRYDDAIAEYRQATTLLGAEPPVARGLLGYAFGRAGRRADAREQLVALQAASEQGYVPAEYLVVVHMGLGDHESALDTLGKARDNRSSGIAYLLIEPMLQPLRRQPGFLQLVRDAGL